jgi:hypothetical protein
MIELARDVKSWFSGHGGELWAEITIYTIMQARPYYYYDGTPHWHLLLFVSPEQKDRLIEICRDYALQVDGDEKGAQEHNPNYPINRDDNPPNASCDLEKPPNPLL